MTPLRRVCATAVLVAAMIGFPSGLYPLVHGYYAVGAVVSVSAIGAVLAFRRLTEAAPYSRTASVIAALAALVFTADALGRTEVGKPGGARSVSTQVGLILLTYLAGVLVAFAASFLRLKRPVSPSGGADRRATNA